MKRIEPAGIGQQIDGRRSDLIFLKTHLRLGSLESLSVRDETEHSQISRLVLAHLAANGSSPSSKLLSIDVISRGTGPRNDVGDPVTQRQHLGFVESREQARSEARSEDGRPEQVAGTRKMMSHRGGVQTGIDSAEQDLQIRFDHVGNSSANGLELFAT